MINAASNQFLFHRAKFALYTLVIAAIGSFAYRDNSPGLLIAGLVVAGIAWLFVDSPYRRNMPRFIINLAILGAAIWFWSEITTDDSNRQDRFNLIVALGHFMIVLVVCKLFEGRTLRDFTQILILSLLIVVAGSMFSSTLSFAFILAGFLGLAVYTIIILHLHSVAESAIARHHIPAILPSQTQVPAFLREVRRAALQSAMLLLPISIILFMALPRGRAPSLLATWGSGASSQTGSSGELQSHDYGQLSQSDEIVMIVTLLQGGEKIGSAYNQPYFRESVLDYYSAANSRFVPGPDQIREATSSRFNFKDGYAALPGFDYYDGPVVTQVYEVRIPSRETIFSISPALKIAVADEERWISAREDLRDMTLRREGGKIPLHYTVYSPKSPDWKRLPDQFAAPSQVRPGSLGPFRSSFRFPVPAASNPAGFPPVADAGAPASASAATAAPAASTASGPDLPAASRPRSAPVMVSGEITRLARNLLPLEVRQLPPDQPVPEDQIASVVTLYENYLRTNYAYSLTFKYVDKSLDPTTDFLLNRRESGGTCENFAAALAMMCRAVGINARVVTGYHGGEFNSVGGYYIVRQKYAHAWVEVCLPNVGWKEFDATPESSGPDLAAPSVTRVLQEISEVIQNLWAAAVVSFDNDSRIAVLGSLKTAAGIAIDFIRTCLATLYFGTIGSLDSASGDSLSLWTRATFIGPLIGLLCVATWFIRRWRRDRGHRFILVRTPRRGSRLPADLAFLDQLFRILARARMPRSPHQTPREYVDQLRSSLGPAAQDADRLIQMFYALRFGALPPSPQLQAEVTKSLHNVRESLRHP